MLTPKQKQSLEHVADAFEFFLDKVNLVSTQFVSSTDELHLAAKLTEVYFANHHPDGTPCDSEEVSE